MKVSGVVVVVGAGGRVGRQVALKLVECGAWALICADMNKEAALETSLLAQDRQRKLGKDLCTVVVSIDVRNEDSVKKMVKHIFKAGGGVDAFVYATDITALKSTLISAMSLEEYRILEKDHNIGPFLCLRSVLQFMLKQEFKENSVSGRLTRGAIVILTSLASEGSLFGVGNHMLPKDTVKGLVQTAALENARKGIRVNAVAFSDLRPTTTDGSVDTLPNPKQALLGDLPMARSVDPREVAEVVAFLASSSASYINGQMLVVDGGASLQLANQSF